MTRQEIKESYKTMDPSKFYVVSWDTGELLSEHAELKDAKKACRKLGGTPKDGPVAFVGQYCKIWDEAEVGVVYNPRFTH